MSERKFDTSRFKGTSMNKMQAQDNQVNKTLGIENKKTRGDFHELEKGLNYFRIYPHHNAVREMCGETDPNDLGETFAEPRVIYYLPQWVEDKDEKGNVKFDAKKKPIMKEIQKSVFDSRIHGGTKRDIVDEYIKLVHRYADKTFTEQQKAEKDEFLEPLVGNWKKRISGLSPKTTWVMFCDQITKYDVANDKTEKKFGKLEIGKAVKIGLQKLAAQEQGNQPLGTDPFTDPVEGIAICIDYNPDATQAADYYSVGLYQPKIGTGKFKVFQLTEEDLDNMLSFDSLYKQYKNVYRRRDFELAVEGIKNFDSKFEYGLIGDEEFITLMEEISDYYPVDVNDERSSSNSQQDDVEQPTVEDENQDEFELMTREELKLWHKNNKTGFICNQKTTDEQLKSAARDFKTNNPDKFEEEQQTDSLASKSNIDETKERLRKLREKNTGTK